MNLVFVAVAIASMDAGAEPTGMIHSPHPCGSPFGQSLVQIGCPAD